jgi:VCBS repeat-containing protein
VASVQLAANGVVMKTISANSELLIDAIDNIPDSSFFRSPTKERRKLLLFAQAVEKALSRGHGNCGDDQEGYNSQAVELLLNLRMRVDRELNDSTLTATALQQTKAGVLKLIDLIGLHILSTTRTIHLHNHSVQIRILPTNDDRSGRHDLFQIASVTQGQFGVVYTNSDGTVTYRADGQPASDRFTVVVQNVDGDSSAITVLISTLQDSHRCNSEQ